MSSFNRITDKWHAYIRVDKKRKHLGYYLTKEDADEAEKLGAPTDKVWTRGRSAEVKAVTIIEKMLGRKIDLPKR